MLKLHLSVGHLVIVDSIIALLPKVTNHSREMENLLLKFSWETVTVHSESFLTDFGRHKLLNAFSNPNIVSIFDHTQISGV